jgi:hypothetical protein
MNKHGYLFVYSEVATKPFLCRARPRQEELVAIIPPPSPSHYTERRQHHANKPCIKEKQKGNQNIPPSFPAQCLDGRAANHRYFHYHNSSSAGTISCGPCQAALSFFFFFFFFLLSSVSSFLRLSCSDSSISLAILR